MLAPHDLTACILAGGRARRMGGATKPLLLVDGATILSRQRAILTPRTRELLLALAPPSISAEIKPAAPPSISAEIEPADPLRESGLRIVDDRVPDAGPLAGIAAALAAIDTPWLLAVAGDMPDLSAAVIDLLRARAAAADAADLDAIAPRIDGLPEPLCALWHRRALPVLDACLARRAYKVAAVFDDLRVGWIDEPALRAADPALASFRNINRPDEL